ncbi:hypothetical protein D7V97_40575 [Corallococcus sp. CA053C]|uniref:hypothetical protein n=1 Tax=Corallococcus sp. CA053C TaxID=2316732 RepID=UPI000EA10D10|nr:hypothetical protein [Corallococcus sp. CA053C]RKG92763.1 hypothetical protein D7V97_40575 [Corallococcus sp. CA053C]
MSQQAHRPAPPTTDETPDAPAPVVAETFLPLAVLLEEVKSPGVLRSDIDALIAALGRAPPPDESLRERADLLLGLMARENPVGDYVGKGGRKVRHAAKDALLSLGYPYALELPPELLEPQAPVTTSDEVPSPGPGPGGVIITLLSVLCQTLFCVLGQLLSGYFGKDFRGQVLSPFVLAGLIIWVSTLSSFFGHSLGNRTLQRGGSVGLWLQFVFWAVASLFVLSSENPLAFVFLPWHLTLGAALSMRPVPEAEEPLAPKLPTPTP